MPPPAAPKDPYIHKAFQFVNIRDTIRMTTRLPRPATLAAFGLLTAALACSNAMAASYEGTAMLGKLRFEVNGTGGYSLNNGADSFIGSLTAINIDNSQNPSNSAAIGFTTSSTLTTGEFGSPFDTTQTPVSVSANGQSATAEIAQNLIKATVSTAAQSGFFGYAEGNIGALNLNNGVPSSVQNTLLIDAHTSVTIHAGAYIGLNLLDAAACPSCDGQFTAYAALIGGDQFAAYIAANQGDSLLRQSALNSAGISYIGLEQARLSEAHPQTSRDAFLTLTFTNDTDTVQGYGFLAGAWINGNSLPGSTPGTTPAVPEPETWGLALAGLLISGVALRRRQRG